jgi:hypothetical protein
MSLPTATIPTANTDVGGDNPQVARADILQTMQQVNEIRDHLQPLAPGLATGTHTITFSNVVNASAVVSFSGQYIRVGNEVHAAFGITVVASAAGGVSFLGSLPVASNFTTTGDGVGSGAADGAGGFVPVRLVAVGSLDAMGYFFQAPAAGSYTVVGTYMYRVLA